MIRQDEAIISARAQTVMVWWGVIFLLIFGFTYGFLIRMIPLPPATLTAAEVAAFYAGHTISIRIGAAICSWVSAFAVPVAVVVTVQMARLEKGVPIWSILQLAGGCMMSIFLVLPPLFWGIAAFSPERPPEITLLMHEQANLTLVTTDQYFIFQMIAIAVVSLTQTIDLKSPFPRWFGFFTIWAAFMFEIGVAGFLPKTGPFSWNGLFVFWFPFCVYGAWFFTLCFTLLLAIRHQAQRTPSTEAPVHRHDVSEEDSR